MQKNKTLIFIPTYNEKDNVEKIYSEIANLNLDANILFMDDNSPDGTGIILDRLAQQVANVQVIHRPQKSGVGSAHKAGIQWAYGHKYEKLITMDCDFTHSPEYLPTFIRNSEDYDIVLSSRYTLKESLAGWHLFRKFLTLSGHLLSKYLLKMPYDASGSYRVYRLDRIPQETFTLIKSTGYAFFFESLYVLSSNGFSVKEVPIVLPPRTSGHSKMTIKEMSRSVKYIFSTSLKNLISGGK